MIGIDPGTQAVGYAVLDREGSDIRLVDAGVILAPRGEPIEVRLTAIYEALQEKMRRAEADVAAIEEVVYGKSVRSALRTGEGRGVAILAAGIVFGIAYHMTRRLGTPIIAHSLFNVVPAIVILASR